MVNQKINRKRLFLDGVRDLAYTSISGAIRLYGIDTDKEFRDILSVFLPSYDKPFGLFSDPSHHMKTSVCVSLIKFTESKYKGIHCLDGMSHRRLASCYIEQSVMWLCRIFHSSQQVSLKEVDEFDEKMEIKDFSYNLTAINKSVRLAIRHSMIVGWNHHADICLTLARHSALYAKKVEKLLGNQSESLDDTVLKFDACGAY